MKAIALHGFPTAYDPWSGVLWAEKLEIVLGSKPAGPEQRTPVLDLRLKLFKVHTHLKVGEITSRLIKRL